MRAPSLAYVALALEELDEDVASVQRCLNSCTRYASAKTWRVRALSLNVSARTGGGGAYRQVSWNPLDSRAAQLTHLGTARETPCQSLPLRSPLPVPPARA